MRRRTTCSAWCTWNCAKTRRRKQNFQRALRISPNDSGRQQQLRLVSVPERPRAGVDRLLSRGAEESAVPTPDLSLGQCRACARARPATTRTPWTTSRRRCSCARTAAGAAASSRDIEYKRGTMRRPKRIGDAFSSRSQPTAGIALARRCGRARARRSQRRGEPWRSQLRRRFPDSRKRRVEERKVRMNEAASTGEPEPLRALPAGAQLAAARATGPVGRGCRAARSSYGAKQVEALEADDYARLPGARCSCAVSCATTRKLVQLDPESCWAARTRS